MPAADPRAFRPWQARHTGDVRTTCLGAEVALPAQLRLGATPHRSIGVRAHRVGRHSIVELRDAQVLEAKARTAHVSSSSATPAARPPPALFPNIATRALSRPRPSEFAHPKKGPVAIIERGRERMLRGQPIIHGDYDCLGLCGNRLGHPAVDVQITQDEATPVYEYHHRRR